MQTSQPVIHYTPDFFRPFLAPYAGVLSENDDYKLLETTVVKAGRYQAVRAKMQLDPTINTYFGAKLWLRTYIRELLTGSESVESLQGKVTAAVQSIEGMDQKEKDKISKGLNAKVKRQKRKMTSADKINKEPNLDKQEKIKVTRSKLLEMMQTQSQQKLLYTFIKDFSTKYCAIGEKANVLWKDFKDARKGNTKISEDKDKSDVGFCEYLKNAKAYPDDRQDRLKNIIARVKQNGGPDNVVLDICKKAGITDPGVLNKIKDKLD